MLKQGLIVIQNGINRYKYFIFYMPPIYTMIEELPIEQFLRSKMSRLIYVLRDFANAMNRGGESRWKK